MASTTPVYDLPFQESTDPPDGAAVGQDLAEAVETELVRVDADVADVVSDLSALSATVAAGGFVAENSRTSAVTATGTTEIVVQSLTFAAVSGVRYKITSKQSVQNSIVNVNVVLRLRIAAGNSVSITDTIVDSDLTNADTASRGNATTQVITYVAPSTGNFTVGATIQRSGGSGDPQSFASSAQICRILVERT